MNLAKTIKNKISTIYQTLSFFYKEIGEISAGGFKPSVEEEQYSDFLVEVQKRYPLSDPSEILLVPLMNDVAMMRMIVEFAYKIASENHLAIKYFYVHTAVDQPIPRNASHRLLHYVKGKRLTGIDRLTSVYKIEKGEVLLSNYFIPKIRKSVTEPILTKDSLVNKLNGDILVGDIIYDTYLRFRNKPTVDLSDPGLYEMIDYSDVLAEKWKKLFQRKSIKQILLPYGAYIHWGIPARVALKNNVEVLTFGSYLYLLSNITIEYPFHSKNHHRYKEIYQGLDKKEGRIESAKKVLESRISGDVDQGTVYMKSSAFHNSGHGEFYIDKSRPSAIIFLHCFFDSPHIYNGSIFPDFYEWIVFLLDSASTNPEVNFYVKPHPNGLPANKEIVSALKKTYDSFPNIQFIPSEISNRQIIEQKPSVIFTVYGTVGHEFAYLGFPVVTAGDNPHTTYDFLYNPETIDEFGSFIDKIGEYGLPENYDKEQILEFFYMHYLYYSEELDQNNFKLLKNFHTGQITIPAELSLKSIKY